MTPCYSQQAMILVGFKAIMSHLWQASPFVFIFIRYWWHQKDSFSGFTNTFIDLEYEYLFQPSISSRRAWVTPLRLHAHTAPKSTSQNCVGKHRKMIQMPSHPRSLMPPLFQDLLLVLIGPESTTKILKLSFTWSHRVKHLSCYPIWT